MKKIISLLLIVVMAVSLLSGVSLAADYEKPTECAQADAGVMVTTADDATVVYYFETLSSDVFAWARQQVSGAKTFTVLKDLQLDDSTGYSDSRYLNVNGTKSDWFGGNGTTNPITIDLGGKTVTYTGSANFLYIERYGITLCNGTLIYNGTESRGVVTIGTATGQTATSSGAVWLPQVKLDGVEIYANSEAGAGIITNNVHCVELEVKDCVLWTSASMPLRLWATDQSGLSDAQVPYEGEFTATLKIKDSTVGSGDDYVLDPRVDGYTVIVEDSILVTNESTGALIGDKATLEIDSKGDEFVEDAAWTGTVAGNKVSGKAYKYGDAGVVELPFTDVAEGDWYYEFVSEMYAKGVINGMTETTFVPNGTLTYGQALKLIAVGLGKGEQPAGSHWASGYLTLAKAEGWLASDVDLNGSVSRLAFCQIAAKAKGLTEQPASNPFTDTADTDVLALVNAGVINGMTANTFMPDGLLTRAQIAKIISLLVKL